MTTILGATLTTRVELDTVVIAVALNDEEELALRMPAANAFALAEQLRSQAAEASRGYPGRTRDEVAGEAGGPSGEVDGEAEDTGVPVGCTSQDCACHGLSDAAATCG